MKYSTYFILSKQQRIYPSGETLLCFPIQAPFPLPASKHSSPTYHSLIMRVISQVQCVRHATRLKIMHFLPNARFGVSVPPPTTKQCHPRTSQGLKDQNVFLATKVHQMMRSAAIALCLQPLCSPQLSVTLGKVIDQIGIRKC